MADEITPQDRANARQLIRDMDDAARRSRWFGWFFRGYADVLRWMITHD